MPLSAALAFVVASGLSATRGETLTFPAVASAAGSCSLAPLVCANDSSPGCETICAGEQNAVCVEGTCSTAGNIVTPNRCSCR
jgi:hypothetical protein